MIEVGDLEVPVEQPELQLAALQDRPVAVAEDGDQHLVLELLLDRVPFDVEEARRPGGRAVLQQVHPQRVAGPDPHVVRDDVEDVSKRLVARGRAHRGVVLGRAELGVQLLVVEDVVAVVRAGGGAHVRRGVEVGDPEILQVSGDRRRGAEPETAVQLHPVGRERQASGRPPPPRSR